MHLVTFAEQGIARIGARVERGILDFSRVSDNIPRTMIEFLSLGESTLSQARNALSAPQDGWIIPVNETYLLAPVPNPGKILCMGHNYIGHIGIGKTEIPEYPNLFIKSSNTIIGHNNPILIPPAASEVDFEAELMAVIGKRAYCVTEAEATIAGYTIFNDVSARDYQRRTSQWMLGKSFDSFGPMGPALVTPDELPGVYQLNMELTVNGVPQQCINTRDIIFSVPYLIAYISQVMTLEVGDVIATGTPAKLPEASQQKRFLQPGDVVEITIDQLGRLSNPVASVAEPG
ncbi:MAG: fumarylacetoacetate hydrolase family protein [Anaerolineaceae bacterium]|nr:fumarylacetoacetate hydrolase family protein [Anaerolineaceae bacterium]MBN2677958.1 fumarylacetoacetate hydrolase family protein [Anaerolineaceae bacterium]